jgi:hypothetical protein
MPKLGPEQIAKRCHLVQARLAGAIKTTDSDEGVVRCAAKDPGSKAIYAELRKLPAEPTPDDVFVTNSADLFRDLSILEQKKHFVEILRTRRQSNQAVCAKRSQLDGLDLRYRGRIYHDFGKTIFLAFAIGVRDMRLGEAGIGVEKKSGAPAWDPKPPEVHSVSRPF